MSPKETKETAVRAGSRAMFPRLRAIVPLPLIALRQTSRSHWRLPSDKFGIRDAITFWSFQPLYLRKSSDNFATLAAILRVLLEVGVSPPIEDRMSIPCSWRRTR
jgi:hypothetical protein